MKLDIGCGTYKLDGYAGVDAFVDTDYRCPMWDIPVPDDSIDAIYSSHALEHVSKFDVPRTLLEWKRIIRPGGDIVIQVPDLRWCCQQWLMRQSTDWYLDTLFGMQSNEGEFHKTGFTPAIMGRYLQDAGLVLLAHTVVDSHGQPTLEFKVTK